MSFFSSWSKQIYDYVTGFLPWGYVDTARNSTLNVLKTPEGLRVVTTDRGLDGTGYREITVDIPQSDIEILLKR